MITPRLRPRLEMAVPLTPAALAAHVERLLAEADAPCRGLVTDGQIELRIRGAERHFWSPQLVVRVREHEGGSALTGHFGPDAPVWTMFLASYGFVVLGTIIASFFGLAQLTIGEPPWALWSVPVALVLVAGIYAAAGVGQRLGRDQVDVLQAFLERACAAPDAARA